MDLKEKVSRAWKRLEDIKDTAEQHLFPKLLFIDIKMLPLYDDLLKNWDDHHAEVFLKGMDNMFKLLGLESMEEWEAKQ